MSNYSTDRQFEPQIKKESLKISERLASILGAIAIFSIYFSYIAYEKSLNAQIEIALLHEEVAELKTKIPNYNSEIQHTKEYINRVLSEFRHEFVRSQQNFGSNKIDKDDNASVDGNDSGVSEPSSIALEPEGIIDIDTLNNELSNLPRLYSQVRVVPYYQEGQVIGLRLFALRHDSLYQKIGLKNGDVILAINDRQSPDHAELFYKYFEELRENKTGILKIVRNGEERDLTCRVK